MGDRPPEGPVLRTLCIHVDPLMVVGSVGEGGDPVLIDVDPGAGTEFLPDVRSQVVKGLNACCHWASSQLRELADGTAAGSEVVPSVAAVLDELRGFLGSPRGRVIKRDRIGGFSPVVKQRVDDAPGSGHLIGA